MGGSSSKDNMNYGGDGSTEPLVGSENKTYDGSNGKSNLVQVKQGRIARMKNSVTAHEVEDDTPKFGPNSDKASSCHDCPCVGLFGIYWIGMFFIVWFAFTSGDTMRLFYPTDYLGNTCGTGKFVNKRYGYYPRLAQDVLSAIQDEKCDLKSGSCELDLYTICVDSTKDACPMAGDVVCTYAKDKAVALLGGNDLNKQMQLKHKYAASSDDCWYVGVNMTNKFFRCVPWPDKASKNEVDVCKEYDEHGNLVVVDKPKAACKGAVTETKTTVSTTTGGADVLLYTLASYTYYIQELFSDIITTKWVIFIVGGGVSVLASFSFIILLSFFAGIIVWMIIINAWIVIASISTFLFLKSGDFFGIDMAIVSHHLTSTLRNASSDSDVASRFTEFAGPSTDYAVYYGYGAYFFFAIACMYFCIVCVLKSKIDLCIEIMKSSGRFIRQIKTLPFFPLIIYAWQFFLLLFCICVVLLIESIKDVTTADLATAVHAVLPSCANSANTTMCVADLLIAKTNGTTGGNSTMHTETSLRMPMHVFNIFGFLWTLNVFSAVGMVTIATAVASTYWQRKEDGPVSSPVIGAFKKTMTYHYGSCIFGAAIIAVIQLARLILAYVDSKTKQLQETQKWVKLLMCAIKCCLWCFEKVVKYLTRNAYILIAIEGNNFCTSAMRSFRILFGNLLRIGIVQSVTYIVVLLGKLSITAFCVMLSYVIMTSMATFQEDGDTPITSPLLPCITIGFMSFIISVSFMETYGVTSDTLVFSYCLDEKYHSEGKYEEGRGLFASSHGIDNSDSGFEKASKGAKQQQEMQNAVAAATSKVSAEHASAPRA